MRVATKNALDQIIQANLDVMKAIDEMEAMILPIVRQNGSLVPRKPGVRGDENRKEDNGGPNKDS